LCHLQVKLVRVEEANRLSALGRRRRRGDGAGDGAGAVAATVPATGPESVPARWPGRRRCRPAVGESPTDQSVERVVDYVALGLPRHGLI